MKMIILLSFLISTISTSYSQMFNDMSFVDIEKSAVKGKWANKFEDDGVSLQYRSLIIGDSIETRMLSMSFYSNLSIDSIIPFIKDTEKILSWNKNVLKSENYDVLESSWINHTIYNTPLLITKQDLICKYEIVYHAYEIHIIISPLPNFLPSINGFKRELNHYAYWNLKPLGIFGTKITYSVISISNSQVPRFIKDKIIKRKMMESFLKLKAKCNIKAN